MNPIKDNGIKILVHMIDTEQQRAGGDMIKEWFDLSPQEINDAVEYLKSLKFVDVLTAIGTAPYNFLNIKVTSKGRIYYHDL
jgi:hypothetical protein